MSIQNQLRVIHHIEKWISHFQAKYAKNTNAADELNKLSIAVKKLEKYLTQLDQVKPNYSTNEINSYIEAINLNLDLLKKEIEVEDYRKLAKGINTVKLILRFHAKHYNYFTFILAWFYEWLYYI